MYFIDVGPDLAVIPLFRVRVMIELIERFAR